MHGVDVLEEAARDGVARLVIGGQPLGAGGHLAALLLRAHLDLEDGLVDVFHRDEAVAATHGQQRGLVHQVFQVRAGEAGRALGDGVEVDVLGQLLAAGVDLQNGLAAADVGQGDVDLAVKAARAQQRLVEDVRAVGRGHDDDALVVREAVELDKQLVERLLALVVAAAEAAASLTADGVDLVDEDDRGGDLLGLVEQVAHAARAHADVELDKVRARDRQELDVRLARDGLGQQRFARARRADEQHALGDARAHGRVGLRVLEEVDDLAELLLLLVAARDVGEGLFVLLVDADARARLAELRKAPGAAARLLHHRRPEPHRQRDEDDIGQQTDPPRDGEALSVVVFPDHAALMLFGDQVAEILVKDGEAVKLDRPRLGQLLAARRVRLPGAEMQLDLVAAGDEGLHLLRAEEVDQVGIDRLLLLLAAEHRVDRRGEDHQDQDVKADLPASVSFRFQALVTSYLNAFARFTLNCRFRFSARRYTAGCGSAGCSPARSRRRRRPAPQSRRSLHKYPLCGARVCPSAWRS